MSLHAVVEIMGHRTRAGAISDAQLGGATLLRIEHPTRVDHTGGEPVAEYYAPSAIFAIRPCSAEEAQRVAAWAWPEPRAALGPGLPPELAEHIDADDDYPDDDDDDLEVDDDPGRPF